MEGNTTSEMSLIATGRPIAASARGSTIAFNFSLVNITFRTIIPAMIRTTGIARIVSQIFDLRLIGMACSGGGDTEI